jgi:hypothetical protein
MKWKQNSLGVTWSTCFRKYNHLFSWIRNLHTKTMDCWPVQISGYPDHTFPTWHVRCVSPAPRLYEEAHEYELTPLQEVSSVATFTLLLVSCEQATSAKRNKKSTGASVKCSCIRPWKKCRNDILKYFVLSDQIKLTIHILYVTKDGRIDNRILGYCQNTVFIRILHTPFVCCSHRVLKQSTAN